MISAGNQPYNAFFNSIDIAYAKILSGRATLQDQGLQDAISLIENGDHDKNSVKLYLHESTMQLLTHFNPRIQKFAFKLFQHMIDMDYFERLDRILLDIIYNYLEDPKLEIRHSAAEVLGTMAKKYGSLVWFTFQQCLLLIIESNFERPLLDLSSIRQRGSLGCMMHDTEGWHALESAIRSILLIIKNIGPQFASNITYPLLDLFYRLLRHKNRFVRETTLELFEVLITHVFTAEQMIDTQSRLLDLLPMALVDTWSHVTMAASKCARALALRLKLMAQKELEQIEEDLDEMSLNPLQRSSSHTISISNPIQCIESIWTSTMLQNAAPGTALHPLNEFVQHLLPFICFNRYSTASGIREYSLHTWRLLVCDQGPTLVTLYFPSFIGVYLNILQSSDASYLESACYCIRELLDRINPQIVAPHVANIFSILRLTLSYPSCLVRETACITITSLIPHLQSMDDDQIESLYQLLLKRNQDELKTTRQAASSALGQLARTFPSLFLQRIITYTHQSLAQVLDQPMDPYLVPNLEDFYGPIAKKAHDNDPSIHMGQHCLDCNCHSSSEKSTLIPDQTPEPWQVTEGAIFLLNQIAQTSHPITTSTATSTSALFMLLTRLFTVTNQLSAHFSQYNMLIYTIWTEMRRIISESHDPMILAMIWPILGYDTDEEHDRSSINNYSTSWSLPRLIMPQLLDSLSSPHQLTASTAHDLLSSILNHVDDHQMRFEFKFLSQVHQLVLSQKIQQRKTRTDSKLS